jgi:hypothetical protein
LSPQSPRWQQGQSQRCAAGWIPCLPPGCAAQTAM